MTSSDLRYGIIGTGMMGLEHIWNLQHLDGATVTAMADTHEHSRRLAKELAELGEEVSEFSDHRALLDSGRCDAVVIATPNHTHVDVLDDVLATDLPVLVEKPLCTTVEDCRRVLAAAEGRQALVWVGLEYRFMPPVARLVQEVHTGTVGPVRMVAIREHRFPFLHKVDHWNRFNRNTGGTLVEKCCHFFDLMNHVVGDRPERVQASGAQDVNHLDERYDGEIPDILDNAFVIVDYDDGARAVLDLCMFAEAGVNQEEISVVGDRGKVEAFLPSCEVRIGERSSGAAGVRAEVVHDPAVRYEGFHHGSSYLEHVQFRDAVLAGGAAGVGLESGLLSVAMGVAGHRSIDEQRSVSLDEVLA